MDIIKKIYAVHIIKTNSITILLKVVKCSTVCAHESNSKMFVIFFYLKLYIRNIKKNTTFLFYTSKKH